MSSETDPGDMMDALEDLWNTRIRRNLDATADEVKQGLMAGLQRDKQDYEQKRTEAKARQDAGGLAHASGGQHTHDPQGTSATRFHSVSGDGE